MITQNRFFVKTISTKLPRECGIAKYDEDLSDSIRSDDRILHLGHYSIVREINSLDYLRPIEGEIEQGNTEYWQNTTKEIVQKAEKDRGKGIETGIIVDWEYGIFGDNEKLDYVTPLLQNLNKNKITNITIAHTTLSKPNSHQRKVMGGIIENTDQVICLTPSQIKILRDIYNAPREKLIYIPHGIPKIEIEETREELKKDWELEDKIIISTAGFVSPRKAIENPIKAIAKTKRDDLIYFIAGVTHPEVRRREGEKYRESLINLAENSGLNPFQTEKKDENILELMKKIPRNCRVVFLNSFLEDSDLFRLLKGTDLGIVPNTAPEQISSGQIAYWIGAGRAFITTETPYAKDMENEGIGLLAEFENPESIYKNLGYFLTMEKAKRNLEFAATRKAATMSWPDVGKRMLNVLAHIIDYKQGEK